jgi:hypothetical protein
MILKERAMFSLRAKVASGIFLLISLVPTLATAHHSTAGFFNPARKVEVEGVITAVQWRNPHTVFELDVPNAEGELVQWHVESGALGILRAQGLTSDILKVGDRVKILGDESRRGRPEMFARNILLPSGKEVMLTLGASVYFSTQNSVELLAGGYNETETAAARAEADGIFRVWSRIGETGRRLHTPIFSNGDIDTLPLTAKGREIREQWDGSAEFILGCTDWNMPRLMGNPLPMQFVQVGEDIVIRFEEGDNQRTVHMDPNAAPTPVGPSLMGFSVGHWERNTLVIQTTQLQESTYSLPVSRQAELLERFTPSPDGSRLDYEIVFTDQPMLTSPVTQRSAWFWRPEIQVNSYACEVEQEIN